MFQVLANLATPICNLCTEETCRQCEQQWKPSAGAELTCVIFSSGNYVELNSRATRISECEFFRLTRL